MGASIPFTIHSKNRIAIHHVEKNDILSVIYYINTPYAIMQPSKLIK
jgi:hypothetical protein